MSVNYDIDVLGVSKEFDAMGAEKNFENREAFFDRLTWFVEKHADYLRSYNPTMVIYSSEIQQQFLDEIAFIEPIAMQLKMLSITDKINDIREAIKICNNKEVSDGIIMFRAKMEIAAADILSAKLPDIPSKPETQAVKPLLLAVDDRTTVLASVTGVLQRYFKVISVTDSNRALDMLKRHIPAMLLIGVEMHDMHGYKLAEQIRQDKKFQNTPILFMTDVAAAVGKRHIMVPIDRKLLLKKVEDALSGNAF